MNILFDLDGTLTDPLPGIRQCIRYTFDILGMELPSNDDLGWCVGPPLRDSFAKLLASDDATLIEKAIALYRSRYSIDGLFENSVYEGIPEALESLQNTGHKLYVATSKPTVYAKRTIDHFKLQRYFLSIYGSELDGTRTHKENLISHILQREAISSSKAVMVGDRGYDILGAKANGVRGFGVLWGYGTREELETSGAYDCIAHPDELTIA